MLQHLNPVDANEILLINITLVKVFINVLCISYAIAHSYTKRKKICIDDENDFFLQMFNSP